MPSCQARKAAADPPPLFGESSSSCTVKNGLLVATAPGNPFSRLFRRGDRNAPSFIMKGNNNKSKKNNINAGTCCPCSTDKKVLATSTLCRGGHSAHHHHHQSAVEGIVPAPYGIPLNGWKVIFQALLTAMNVVCWLVPLKSKKMTQNKLALSIANAFSGGVFLSLAFGHLIPECVHGFPDSTNDALLFLLVLTGYLLIFFVEKVAFDAHDILHEMQGDDDHHHHHHNHHHHHPATTTPKNSNGIASGSGRSAVILLGALAVHSILEMMALGLANSFGDCALLSLSISLHQPAESIALLVAFLKSGMSESQIIKYLSIFSCMGPVGVGLGMAVNQFASPVVDAAILAIVAGTFVYVGATEVIPEEWEDSSHKWTKFGALMAGIVSIVAITQYTLQFHDH